MGTGQRGLFDPCSIDSHYGLELACFYAHRPRPRSLRVCTHHPGVAKAVVQRLAWTVEQLVVDSDDIACTLRGELGINVSVRDLSEETDVALMPMSRRDYVVPPRAQEIVVAEYNAISYKSLLYPVRVKGNVIGLLRWLRSRYDITDRVGLLGPGFVLRWMVSLLAGTRLPSLHFHMGQKALDHVHSTGRLWWLGYITVIVGRQRA